MYHKLLSLIILAVLILKFNRYVQQIKKETVYSCIYSFLFTGLRKAKYIIKAIYLLQKGYTVC